MTHFLKAGSVWNNADIHQSDSQQSFLLHDYYTHLLPIVVDSLLN